MNTIVLERYAYSPYGTMGRLFLPDHKAPLMTCENPWEKNQINISCIPEGSYLMQSYNSTKFGRTWIIPVTGRSGILFHVGNTIQDTRGCILPGLRAGTDRVIDSSLAMDLMREMLLEPVYTLHVTQYKATYLYNNGDTVQAN